MYYSYSFSNDLKVIGHYPQVSLKKGYNPRLPESHWQVKKDVFPNFCPKLELELHDKAIPTDYLHFSDLNGIIISGKFRKILELHKLPRHRFYHIKVYHHNILLEYYWFHYIIDDFWNSINKKESYAEIVNINTFPNIEGKIPIISKDQILLDKKKYKTPYHLRVGKIQMISQTKAYDFYEIQGLGYHIVFSEELVLNLRKNEITGLIFSAFEKFNIDSAK